MSKKPRNTKKQLPNQSVTNPIKSFQNAFLNKAIGEDIINQNQAELLEKENTLREEIETIITEHKAKIIDLDLLEIGYSEKLSALENKETNLAELEGNLNDRQSNTEQQEKTYTINKVQADKDKAQLDKDKSTFSQERIQLCKEQELLTIQKENAEFGFAEENYKSLEKRRVELEQLTQKHKDSMDRWTEQIRVREADIEQRESVILEKESSLSQKNSNELKQLKDDWATEKQQQENKFRHKLQELESQQMLLEQQQGDFSLKEQHIEQKFRIQYESQIQLLKQNKTHLEDSHQKDLHTISKLKNDLLHYADLERELENSDIESVKLELETLRINNRKLKQELSERRVDGLEEENDRLESRVGDLEDEVYELRAKNEEITAELHSNRLSSMDKHHLQKEKRVLTSMNQALDLNVEQLSKQLEKLEGSQNEQLAFKALNNMDTDYRDSAINLQDVPDLKQFSDIIQSNIANQDFYYSLQDIRLFIAGLAMSKLHLLQGISGTGKTSLARTFAKAMNNVHSDDENLYCEIVRVQAGWRDKEDLIGYYNEFEKKFNTKEALQAIYRAQQPKFKDTVQIILLDEMNLSQPEQYFAEFLSLLETPDRATINLLDYGSENSPKYFVDKKAIKIPDNVWFVGTANHDETTKEFADKTYDRAHVMEVKRSKEKCTIDNATDEQYSFSSLIEKFKTAEQKGKRFVESIFEVLKDSDLEKELHVVGVSWGNRLEKQAKSFIPVYQACGGEVSEALDHLFASKVFRHGKLTGRYDISAEQMQKIKEALEEIWLEFEFENDPVISNTILENDIKRLGDL